MRKQLADHIFNKMKLNPKIFLITCDLGYKVWDEHFKAYPDRCINVGASEQAGVGIAVGLALQGKIPFVYSITNFVLYRPFEWIRNYLSKENVGVCLVGSGRDKDYTHEGLTHWSEDAKQVLDTMPAIEQYFPEDKSEINNIIDKFIKDRKPSFISLKRS
jgi:transketolase